MKRILLASLGMLFTLHGCRSSDHFMYRYVFQTPVMHGKVASVSTLSYGREIKEDLDSEVKAKMVIQEKQLELYDRKGNLIEQHYYYPNGSLSYKWIHAYNSIGQKTESGYYYGGRLRAKNIYTYNAQGKLLQNIYYQPIDSINYISNARYDEKGNLVEVDTAVDQPWGKRNTYVYSHKGRTVRAYTYLPDGTLDSITDYRFDRKGNLVHCESLTPDGFLTFKSTSTFDKRGNEIETSLISNSAPDKEPADSTKWKIVINLTGHWTVEYAYDEKGNWVKYIQDSQGDTTFYDERKIKYFK